MDKTLFIYTIYKPKGFKTNLVLRDKIEGSNRIRDEEFMLIGPIEKMRDYFQQQGLMVIPRSDDDTPDIIESWL